MVETNKQTYGSGDQVYRDNGRLSAVPGPYKGPPFWSVVLAFLIRGFIGRNYQWFRRAVGAVVLVPVVRPSFSSILQCAVRWGVDPGAVLF